MTFRRSVATCAFLLCLLVWAAVAPCRAQQPQGPGETPYDQRTDAFRRLLFELRFQPLRGWTELEENKPSELLFILLGNPDGLSEKYFNRYFPRGLRSFVAEGGAVLIATDMPTEGKAGKNLNELAGVTVADETLVIRNGSIDPQLSQEYLYHNVGFCPYVKPIEDTNVLGEFAGLVGAGRPELFRSFPPSDQPLMKIATNAPSRLKELKESRAWLPRSNIHRLARLPEECRDVRSNRIVDEKGPLFAVGGTVGKGRVLVLADHSIFINRMMLPRDNDNLQFAANCLHWLRGASLTMTEALQAARSRSLPQLAGQRNKVLLWVDGKLYNDFEVPLKRMPAPPSLPSEQAIVAAIDNTVAKLEDTDAFNRALLERIDGLPGGRERILRSAVFLLTLAALLFLGYRFVWLARYRPELAVPLLSKALREHEPSVSLLDQRRRALLRLGNVWEMGHRLARECFESAGVALTGALPPRVLKAQGNPWQRWRINRRVARLWRLARGDAPMPLTPIALKHRMRELEELKTALANGTIELMGERPA
jgi:hypothetical protein